MTLLFSLSCPLLLPLSANDKTQLLSETGVGAGVSETLAYSDNIVYIARHTNGVDVMDVLDPFHPVKLTTIDPDGPNFSTVDVWDVQVLNNILYVFNCGSAADPNPGKGNFTGVYMYDISNPMFPVEVGAIVYGLGPNYHLASITKSGEAGLINGVPHIFVCSNMSTCVEIFDVSNPAQPVFKSTVVRPQWKAALETVYQNGLLYTAWGTEGFTIHNVTNPQLPVRLGRQVYVGPTSVQSGTGVRTLCPTPDGTHVVTGEFTTSSDVRLWNVTNPSSIAQVASWRLGTKAYLWSVKATNDYAYVAHLEDGIRILDIRGRTSLTPAGSFDPDPALAIRTWDGIADIALDGMTMFASHETRGLFAVEHDPNQDTVSVGTATYKASTHRLTVYATSTQQPTPTLTVVGVGTMTWKPNKNRYELTATINSAPASVTVRSSAGGSSSRTVVTTP